MGSTLYYPLLAKRNMARQIFAGRPQPTYSQLKLLLRGPIEVFERINII